MAVSDPFAPTETATESPPNSPDGRFEAIGRLAVRWEKLRWLYNAILFPWTLMSALLFVPLLDADVPLLNAEFWKLFIACALFCNACFCCGPIVDGCLTWFFRSHPAVTVALFAAGTLFTMFASTAAVVSFGLDTLGFGPNTF